MTTINSKYIISSSNVKFIFFHITQVSSYTNHPELKAQATWEDTVSGLSRKGMKEGTSWDPATRDSRNRTGAGVWSL